jgi:hypothetical protein
MSRPDILEQIILLRSPRPFHEPRFMVSFSEFPCFVAVVFQQSGTRQPNCTFRLDPLMICVVHSLGAPGTGRRPRCICARSVSPLEHLTDGYQPSMSHQMR